MSSGDIRSAEGSNQLLMMYVTEASGRAMSERCGGDAVRLGGGFIG
ncbi:MAG: hypothetical protein R3C05_19990 [Pirellulaceae bacterium]